MYAGYVVDGADSAIDNEPELRRAALGRDQTQFLTDQRPPINQLILIKLPHHVRKLHPHHPATAGFTTASCTW